MQTASVEVLDLVEFSDGDIAASNCRYETDVPFEPARVRWDAIRKPKGWVSIGRVLYAEENAGWKCSPAKTRPTPLGNGTYQFFDDAHLGGMLVGIILPVGFTVTDFSQITPLPHAAKPHKGRLAILWKLDHSEHRVKWQMTKDESASAVQIAENLNGHIAANTVTPKTIAITIEGGQPSEGSSDEVGSPEQEESPDQKAYHRLALPIPSGPAEWLLEAVRQMPFMSYSVAVVGLIAAATLCYGFFLGYWMQAIFGGVLVFGGMILLRVFAASPPMNEPISLALEAKVITWVVIVVFIFIAGFGVVKMGMAVFTSTEQLPAANQPQLKKSDFLILGAPISDEAVPPPDPPDSIPRFPQAGLVLPTDEDRSKKEFASTSITIINETSEPIRLSYDYVPRSAREHVSTFGHRVTAVVPPRDKIVEHDENFGGPYHLSVLADGKWFPENTWVDLGIIAHRTITVSKGRQGFQCSVNLGQLAP